MAFKSCTSTPGLFDNWLAAPPRNVVLTRLQTLLDWDALRAVVAPTYKEEGRVGFDPVLLVKLLILQRLYDLSDGEVLEEAADRLSFRDFLGLGASDGVPDDTTLVKFRGRLRNHNVFDALLAEIEKQLKARGVEVKPGSIKLIDATLVQAAVNAPPKAKEGQEAPKALDPDADWTVKRGEPHYGYKLHLAQDRQTGLITASEVTAASVHDSRVFEQLLSGTEKEVMADKAYDAQKHREAVERNGSKYSVMKRAAKGKPLSAWRKGRNRSIGRVRAFIEGSIGRLKNTLGCERARYVGKVRVREQMKWSVTAFNFCRAAALVGAPAA